MNFKILCVAFSLLSGAGCLAQNQPAFRIISFDGDVSIDETAVHFDQQVTTGSSRLRVKKDGYAGIITSRGLVIRLDRGSYDVAEIASTKHWPTSGGMVHDGPQTLPKIFESNNTIFGESIFLKWPRLVRKDVTITITSMFGDQLFDTLIQSKQIVTNVRRFFEHEQIIVISAKTMGGEVVVKPAVPAQIARLNYDLARIENHPHKMILRVLILKLNDLHFDMALRASQLSASALEGLPDDLKIFADEMMRDYQAK
jgi:hypothetical protein